MARRSCDVCVRRKAKCDNKQPCRKCTETKNSSGCTYLNPILKRGPKAPRNSRLSFTVPRPIAKRVVLDPRLDSEIHQTMSGGVFGKIGSMILQPSVLVPIIDVYKRRTYPVWPVVNPRDLINRLKTPNALKQDTGAFVLATALYAATVAQLQLDDALQGAQRVGAQAMEQECTVLRTVTNYREHPSSDNVLASFFLHVYHAKIDNRYAAMMFLQEAIYFARMLGLDAVPSRWSQHNGISVKGGLVYLLLWVSER